MGGGGRGRGGEGASSRLKRAARKMVVAAYSYAACGSFSSRQALVDPSCIASTISNSSAISAAMPAINSEFAGKAEPTITPGSFTSKNLCAICLDPLVSCSSSSSSASWGNTSPGQAIFTAQCSHAFHFGCISSNVRHGNVTCPICRAHWTQLPRSIPTRSDPVLRILDDSIANFRVHRRSFLLSARYDDDEPLDPDEAFEDVSRLDLSLLPISALHHPACFHPCTQRASNRAYCLSVKLAHRHGRDLVLVASPNGPHLRLLKQAMASVVCSLRPGDRLAVVTCSSAAARAFPLRRMTSHGKRAALQVIDRIFYMGQTDLVEGLKKGLKILEDRVYRNPEASILHLSDGPTRTCSNANNLDVSVPIHRFHLGFSFGASNGFIMHEFDDFLARILAGGIRELQLIIGDDAATLIRLGDLRGGEERRIMLEVDEREHVTVRYRYLEGGNQECLRTGEVLVAASDKRERHDTAELAVSRDIHISAAARTSNVGSWDYHDPYMARRWAKHLHGYRL